MLSSKSKLASSANSRSVLLPFPRILFCPYKRGSTFKREVMRCPSPQINAILLSLMCPKGKMYVETLILNTSLHFKRGNI